MLFNSLHYLVFFPLVVGLHFLVPHRLRWLVLLLSSCWFYMAFIPSYILFLFAIILIDYFAALGMEATQGRVRRAVLWVSVAANLGILGTFKYFNFFSDNLTAIAHLCGASFKAPHLGMVLPIGLSFHTFQSLAYTFEVYYGRWPAERNLGVYAVYVLFFPQLVAGPIERPAHLLPQLHEEHAFDHDRFVEGMRWMLVGFAKKILIADNLAVWVDKVYTDPTGMPGTALLIATVLFAFQIYCDFSGYSDIARGSAWVFGIRLATNFDKPYLATSVSDFWRRWHISLSSWFRDYVYIPLGGNQRGPRRHLANMIAVFLLSGLWHGANWTFVIWGALHGTYLAVAVWRKRRQPESESAALQGWSVSKHRLQTFALVSFAWIFFRASCLKHAFYVVTHLFTHWHTTKALQKMGMSWGQLGFCSALVAALVAYESVAWDSFRIRHLSSLPVPLLRWGLYYAVLALIVVLGRFEERQFVYFQF